MSKHSSAIDSHHYSVTQHSLDVSEAHFQIPGDFCSPLNTHISYVDVQQDVPQCCPAEVQIVWDP